MNYVSLPIEQYLKFKNHCSLVCNWMHTDPHQLYLKCYSNWTVEHRWKQGNVPYSVLHSLNHPLYSTITPPTQYNYGLFVLSTCLHPSSPTWAEEGRHTNPSSFILTCPSLSDTLLTYYSPSSHLICHLARIFRWPSTLACYLYSYLFSCYTVPSSIHNGAK